MKIDDIVSNRLRLSISTLRSAKKLLESECYRDSITLCSKSSYYAICAMYGSLNVYTDEIDCSLSYFKKNYVDTGVVPKNLGSGIYTLYTLQDKGDFNNFNITYQRDAERFYDLTKKLITNICKYCGKQGVDLKSAELAFYIPFDDLHNFIKSLREDQYNRMTAYELAKFVWKWNSRINKM